MTRIRIKAALGLLGLLLLLSACSSDIRELNDVSVVTVAGIDFDPGSHQYRLTVYSLQAVGKGGSEKTQQGGLIEWTGAASGDSIMECSRNLRSRATKKMVWFHIRVVVVGKQAAEHSLPEVLDFLQRNREIRETSMVVVSDASAEKMLLVHPETNDLLVNELYGMIRNQTEWGKSLAITIKDMIHANAMQDQAYLTGRLTARRPQEKTEKVLALDGAALLQNGKLLGWLPGDQTAVVRLLSGKEKTEFLCVTKLTGGTEDNVSALVSARGRFIRTEFRDGQPVIRIQLRLDGRIHQASKLQQLRKHDVADIERQIGQHIENQINDVIRHSQTQLHADIFGFAEHLYQHHPKQWSRIQPGWKTTFSGMPVHVQVEFHIRSTGTLE